MSQGKRKKAAFLNQPKQIYIVFSDEKNIAATVLCIWLMVLWFLDQGILLSYSGMPLLALVGITQMKQRPNLATDATLLAEHSRLPQRLTNLQKNY